MLTSEGLTAFINGSYNWGKPGTQELEALEYATRSTWIQAGAFYPVVRSRERNLTLTGLIFLNDDDSDVLQAPFNVDRLRGFRGKADADIADSLLGINQFNVTFSQGIDGLGSTENGNPLASRAAGRVDFSKIEGTISPNTAIARALLGLLPASMGNMPSRPCSCPSSAARRPVFWPRFRPFANCWAIAASGARGTALRSTCRHDATFAGAALRLLRLRQALHARCRDRHAGDRRRASAGAGMRLGWQRHVNTDLQVAKAIDGPRNDWRFFFAVTAKY